MCLPICAVTFLCFYFDFQFPLDIDYVSYLPMFSFLWNVNIKSVGEKKEEGDRERERNNKKEVVTVMSSDVSVTQSHSKNEAPGRYIRISLSLSLSSFYIVIV